MIRWLTQRVLGDLHMSDFGEKKGLNLGYTGLLDIIGVRVGGRTYEKRSREYCAWYQESRPPYHDLGVEVDQGPTYVISQRQQ